MRQSGSGSGIVHGRDWNDCRESTMRGGSGAVECGVVGKGMNGKSVFFPNDPMFENISEATESTTVSAGFIYNGNRHGKLGKRNAP